MSGTIEPPKRIKRLDSLTGLRWWAAFGVFAYHMANLAPLPHPMEKALVFGNYGVTFFFVLSGFVLSWSARPAVTPARTFWWRRFARIYPSHFVALLLAIPVFYTLWPDENGPAWMKPFSLGIILLSFVLLQGWWHDPVILFSGNPAAWTLTCEAFFYALHPALNRVLRALTTRGALFSGIGIVALAFCYRTASLMWPAAVGVIPWPVVRLTEFAIGMCLAQAFLRGWAMSLKPLWCYLAGVALIGALIGAVHWAENPLARLFTSFTNEWIIIVCALMIAAVAARDLRGGRSLLRSPLLVWLGDLSYTFYLLHATILYAIVRLVGQQPSSWRNLLWYAGCLVLSIGAASALHYLVERPLEKRMRSWWDARQRARTSIAVTAP